MIYAYFYRIEYSKKCCFYKRNFLNQLIKLVDISEKLERCYEIEKADIIFTISDFVNDIDLINKKLIVYSLQDNSFSNQSIIENKNVLFVLDHCKACNDTIKNLQGEFVLDHCKACNERNNKVAKKFFLQYRDTSGGKPLFKIIENKIHNELLFAPWKN